MLDRFRKLGMREAATDFGQVLLLFMRGRLGDYEFRYQGEGRIGAEPARVFNFRQKSGSAALVIFNRTQAVHQTLEGELWVREPDSLPLRVVLRTVWKGGAAELRDEAAVDYAQTPHGAVMPVSVVHREYEGALLRAENVFRYKPFRMFGADADIKFASQDESNR
jgi:hypothetical protein